MEKTELLCIGNPIVDLFVNIDERIAARYGIFDSAQHIDHDLAEMLIFECAANFKKAEKSSGGGAANVAKIAAMLGMKSTFIGCIGNDEPAAFFEKEMAHAGVISKLIKTNDKTGLCFACNIEGGSSGGGNSELRYAASPGAALELTADNISEEMITSAETIALDGYILDRRALVQHVLLKASRRGIPVALDVASEAQVKSKAEEILTYTRNFPLIIFMNADEAIAFHNTIRKSADVEFFSSEKEKETYIIRDVCPMLKIMTDGEIYPIIVVKLGGRGAVIIAGGNVYHEETFTVIPRNVVGAGDTFCAAFTSAWIRGKSLSECAALGNKAAREILDVQGTKIRSVRFNSIAKILKKEKEVEVLN
ncbi:MAG: PfkB family carbohydrate kinase [Treponema sp.]|nr:PfkB family carbohydrate kinase [Treponema sp.]